MNGEMSYEQRERRERIIKCTVAGIVVAFIVALVTFIIFFPFKKVQVGRIGVEIEMGRVTGNTYDEGWHVINGFTKKIVELDCRIKEKSLPQTEGELKGREIVFLELKVSYRLDPSLACAMYEKGGTKYADIVFNNEKIFDICKGVVAKYSIDEFASMRNEIMIKSREELNSYFNDRGIIITDLALSNYNFEPELEAAISEMNMAAMKQKTIEIENENAKKEAENKKEIAIIEAQAKADAKKIEAEAKAESKRIEEEVIAKAEANAILVKAEAQAEANKKIAESLTSDLIQHELVERWNGVMPIMSGDGGSILNLDSSFLSSYFNKEKITE